MCYKFFIRELKKRLCVWAQAGKRVAEKIKEGLPKKRRD